MFESTISAAVLLFVIGGIFGTICAYNKIKKSVSKDH